MWQGNCRNILVQFKQNNFCLTHLGFGLNVAPKVMATVLKTVLENAVDSYIDDILVDETAVPVQRVVEHFGKFGLITKPTIIVGQH